MPKAPLDDGEAGYIIQRLADASKPFGTRMEISGGTATVKAGWR